VNDTGVSLDGGEPSREPADAVASEIRTPSGRALPSMIDLVRLLGRGNWSLAAPYDIAPFVAWLCSEAVKGISGQVFGAGGAEISIWRQPRPATAVVQTTGWDAAAFTSSARPAFAEHLVSLESEFDLVGGPPVTLATEGGS